MGATPTPPAAEIDVLQCPRCGSPAPIGDGGTTTCEHCRAKVEVPPAHRALRAAHRRETEARVEAARLFEELGRRPTRLQRVASFLFHPISLVLLVGSAMLGLFIVASIVALWSLSPLFQANLWDILPESQRVPLIMIPSVGAFVMGVVLGVHGRRRMVSRRALQAAMAAAPPAHPGGAARCRICGAPLEVPPGALGTRCVYCRADNLVALPPERVAGMRAGARAVDTEIERAAAALDAERRRLRRSVTIQVTVVLAVMAALVGASWHSAQSRRKRASQDWNLAMEEPRVLVRRQVLKPGGRWRFMDTLVLDARCGGPPTLISGAECDRQGCVGWYYAALRRGERLVLATTSEHLEADVTVRLHRGFWWPLHPPGDSFGPVVEKGTVKEGLTSSFEATWSAWYQIGIQVPGDRPGVSFPLCAYVQ